MNLATAFVVVTLSISATSFAGGEEKSQPCFSKKTCGDGQDPRTLQQSVMNQLRQVPQEEADLMAARAAAAKIRKMRALLPEWSAIVPDGILHYVSFDVLDTQQQRAYKFVRMALLVRDMYEDLDINYRTLLTLPSPIDNRILPHVRHKLVGLAFLNAYDLLNAQREDTGSQVEDEIVSLLEIGYWAVYHHRLAENDDKEFHRWRKAMNELACAVLTFDITPAIRAHALNLKLATAGTPDSPLNLVSVFAGFRATALLN